MDEYKYKVVFEYDLNKHVEVMYDVNKKGRKASFIGLVGAILFLVSAIINEEDSTGYIILAIMFLFFSLFFHYSTSKKNYKKTLSMNKAYVGSIFTYEFYDEYINIVKTGGEFESNSVMKYSFISEACIINESLGFLLTKEKSTIFLAGEEVKDIVDFVKNKIINFK